MATRGGARLLGRTDIGSLEVGKCADLFLIDSRRLELVGACFDPRNVLATVGVRGPVDYTVVHGQVTVRQGRLPGWTRRSWLPRPMTPAGGIWPGMAETFAPVESHSQRR